jgi:hypothetical protein
MPDLVPPRMLYAKRCASRSPPIYSESMPAAEKLPGVVAVIRATI